MNLLDDDINNDVEGGPQSPSNAGGRNSARAVALAHKEK